MKIFLSSADKYLEKPEVSHRPRSPVRKTVAQREDKNITSSARKVVDFDNRPQYRKIESRSDIQYDRHVRPYNPSYEANENQYRGSLDQTSQSNMTDPRAIQETEIRFLNDRSQNVTSKPGLFSHQAASRFTHVDTVVPDAGRVGISKRLSGAPYGTSAATYSEDREFVRSGGRPGSEEMNGVDPYPGGSQHGVGIDAQASSGSGGVPGGRLRASLRNIDQNSDGLAKLKERIKSQRQSAAPKGRSLFYTLKLDQLHRCRENQN